MALIFTPAVIDVLAPGFSRDPGRYTLAVELTRITFPYLLLITLVTLYGGILNALQRFAAAAAAPILLNLSLMLALSSLSRNSRYVAAFWVGVWFISYSFAGILHELARQPWCPLISYVGNLERVGEALLDYKSATQKFETLTGGRGDPVPGLGTEFALAVQCLGSGSDRDARHGGDVTDGGPPRASVLR